MSTPKRTRKGVGQAPAPVGNPSGSPSRRRNGPPEPRSALPPAPASSGAGGPRAAVYLRVSTGGQSTAAQRPDVLRLVEARGLELVEVYEEQESAAKARPVFARMLDDARRGRFRVLVVWAIDRFGRSMARNVADVLELDRLGVQLVSVRESWMDTSGPVRDLLVAIFSWVAEQERARLGERTRAGLERARARGIALGRPPVRVDLDHANRLHARGLTWGKVALALGVKRSTLDRARRDAR